MNSTYELIYFLYHVFCDVFNKRIKKYIFIQLLLNQRILSVTLNFTIKKKRYKA